MTAKFVPEDFPPEVLERHPEIFAPLTATVHRGSIAHGTFVPSTDPTSIDDIDVLSIVLPGRGYYTGLQSYGSRGTVEVKHGPWDIVAYEFRKMISMLATGNPNVLSTLWVTPDTILHGSPVLDILLEHRHLFVTKAPYNSFMGYAHQHLERMTRVNTAAAFEGAKRRLKFEQFGYDCKMGSHLIRLLRMCCEFFETGIMRVWRPDHAELVQIKQGAWAIERVRLEAETLFVRAKGAVEACRFPDKPDPLVINRLCQDVVEGALFDMGPYADRFAARTP